MKEISGLEENKDEEYFIGEKELHTKVNLKEDSCKDMVFINFRMDKSTKDSSRGIRGMD